MIERRVVPLEGKRERRTTDHPLKTTHQQPSKIDQELFDLQNNSPTTTMTASKAPIDFFDDSFVNASPAEVKPNNNKKLGDFDVFSKKTTNANSADDDDDFTFCKLGPAKASPTSKKTTTTTTAPKANQGKYLNAVKAVGEGCLDDGESPTREGRRIKNMMQNGSGLSQNMRRSSHGSAGASGPESPHSAADEGGEARQKHSRSPQRVRRGRRDSKKMEASSASNSSHHPHPDISTSSSNHQRRSSKAMVDGSSASTEILEGSKHEARRRRKSALDAYGAAGAAGSRRGSDLTSSSHHSRRTPTAGGRRHSALDADALVAAVSGGGGGGERRERSTPRRCNTAPSARLNAAMLNPPTPTKGTPGAAPGQRPSMLNRRQSSQRGGLARGGGISQRRQSSRLAMRRSMSVDESRGQLLAKQLKDDAEDLEGEEAEEFVCAVDCEYEDQEGPLQMKSSSKKAPPTPTAPQHTKSRRSQGDIQKRQLQRGFALQEARVKQEDKEYELQQKMEQMQAEMEKLNKELEEKKKAEEEARKRAEELEKAHIEVQQRQTVMMNNFGNVFENANATTAQMAAQIAEARNAAAMAAQNTAAQAALAAQNLMRFPNMELGFHFRPNAQQGPTQQQGPLPSRLSDDDE